MGLFGEGGPLIATRAIHFAATATLAGTLIFRMLVAGPVLRRTRSGIPAVDTQTLRVAWGSLAVSLCSGVAWVLLQAPAMSGRSFGEAMTADIIGTVVTETQFGLISEIRLASAIILAASLAADRHPGVQWLSLTSALSLIAAIAWTGHAGATAGQLGILHLTADTLHLVAAAAWIGGLVSLSLLLSGASRDQSYERRSSVRDAVQRFSALGIVCVATLLATGIVNTGILVGSFYALVVTDYGRLLMLKIALFTGMLVFAAVNRFWLMPKLAGDRSNELELDTVRKLVRNCIIEIASGLAIFAIVGAMGAIHPAIHFV